MDLLVLLGAKKAASLPLPVLLACAALVIVSVLTLASLLTRKKARRKTPAIIGGWPKKIGQYRIARPLGRGGMGTVFLARGSDGKRIALKVPDESALSNDETRALFKKEAELQKSMQHENIVRVLDFNDGSWECVPYLALEYVEGTSLADILRPGAQMPLEKAVNMLWQILSGLSCAHKLGVTHQDIKPANIIITRKGRVKIMDFGIAYDRFAGGRSPSQADFVGSPHYMSPEQIAGKTVDYRTDFYSLGILAYQMFTGNLPFDGESPIQIATKHLTEKPPEMRYYNPRLPVKLEKLVMMLLEKDPDMRPFHAGPIKDALKEFRNRSEK